MTLQGILPEREATSGVDLMEDEQAEEVKNADGTTTRKRKKVSKACIYCQKSHMSCDRERPCKRCVNRSIAHLCRDVEAKRRGRKGTYLEKNPPLLASFDGMPYKQTNEGDDAPSTGEVQSFLPDILFSSLSELPANSTIEATEQRDPSSISSLEQIIGQFGEKGKAEGNGEAVGVGVVVDSESKANLLQFFQYLQLWRLSSEEWAFLKKEMEPRRKELQAYRDAYTQAEVDASRLLLQKYLELFKEYTAQVELPCVVWERSGRILFSTFFFFEVMCFV
jgi:hypothetical protein